MYYAPNSHSIVLSSTVHRTQSQNVDECLSKVRARSLSPIEQLSDLTRPGPPAPQLRTLVIEASLKPIQNEPSAEQQARVRGLARAENARRQTDKAKRSAVKQTRKGNKGGSFD